MSQRKRMLSKSEPEQGRKPRDERAPATLARPMGIEQAAGPGGEGVRRIAAGTLVRRGAVGSGPGGESTTAGPVRQG